jgi:hypothetical protein
MRKFVGRTKISDLAGDRGALACEAMAELGQIPKEDAARFESGRGSPSLK